MGERLWNFGARQLASMIEKGDVTSSEVVGAHIERIESVNRLLNAAVVKRYEQAREEALELDRKQAAGERVGPLHGVPITIKECLDFGGLPSTFRVTAHRHEFP